MSRRVGVNADLRVAIDGAVVGRVTGRERFVSLDFVSAAAALRAFRAIGDSRVRRARSARVRALSRASGLNFDARVRGRRVASLSASPGWIERVIGARVHLGGMVATLVGGRDRV